MAKRVPSAAKLSIRVILKPNAREGDGVTVC